MTTLAAIQGDGWAVIGCDSRSSDDNGRPMNLATHKIIENNGILIAGSGSSRGSNILQFGWKAPKPTANESLDKFVTQKFIPQMRQVFIDAGYDMKEDGDAAEHDSSFIIYFMLPKFWKDEQTFYAPQTKILEGRTSIWEFLFRCAFRWCEYTILATIH